MLNKLFISFRFLIFLLFISFQFCFADPDIVIVGAGPIGLYTAVQAKLINPQLKIELFEKHHEYQRKHTLNLDSRSFRTSYKGNEALNEIIQNWGEKVRTSQIETDLLAFSKTLGIEIHYQKIDSLDEIKKMYPSISSIVGADGAHSIVREQLMSGKDQPQPHELQYLAQVKYDVEGSTRSLGLFEKNRVVNRSYHPAFESVGKETEGKTPVTLNILIKKKEYDQLKAANIGFRNPILVGSPQFYDINLVSPRLQDTIRTWVGGREYETHEKAIVNTIRMTPINLVEYFSEQVFFQKDGIDYYLVGDAAFGVPFFRSMNNGIKCANFLSKILSRYTQRPFEFKETTPTDYQEYVSQLEDSEKTTAHFKSVMMSLWSIYLKPWQKTVQIGEKITGGPWKKRYLGTADQRLTSTKSQNAPSKEGLFTKIRCAIFRWL